MISQFSRMWCSFPLQTLRCYLVSLSDQQESQHLAVMGQKPSGKTLPGMCGRRELGVDEEREHKDFMPWMRPGSLYRPFTP